ncbi:hypothetical protein FXO38_33900 [Capsicum annuum]|nr:hypothetical protein FXO38_33900 [Capsicum annuum]KAF3657218.1 hypothetical protein FXO37_15062 [Capsicum annuum]
MNSSHQSKKEEHLSVSDGEKYDHQDDGAEEEEGAMHDDGYTDTLYTTGPIVENSVSLLHNEYENDEELYGGYGDGTNRHLDSDDEDLQNLVDEEMNRSHRFDKEKHLSTSGGEEYDHQDDGAEEDEGAMHNNVYTEAQYIVGPVVGETSLTAILTDQCDIIKAAIREVLPNTLHRHCILHIFTKLRTKLRGVRNYKQAKVNFKPVIFYSITIAKFEDKWYSFIEEYDMGEKFCSKIFSRSDLNGSCISQALLLGLHDVYTKV